MSDEQEQLVTTIAQRARLVGGGRAGREQARAVFATLRYAVPGASSTSPAARFRQGTIVTAEPNAVPSAGCTAMCR